MNILYLPLLFGILTNYSFNMASVDTTLPGQIIPIESAFTAIKIYDDLTVYLTEGDQNEIIVKVDRDSDKIKVRVKDGVLIIRSNPGFLSHIVPAILLRVKKIEAISIMGDAVLRSIGDLHCDKLNLVVNGDGSIYVNTKAIEVQTLNKGSGKIEVRGNFKNTSVNRNASGDLLTTYN